ncbi:hypothetical protein AX16_009596 [Volvariella volvacea WC 439]|nr:hypothetical protein AX16_009596 [Volvariella volvacea WC 439]
MTVKDLVKLYESVPISEAQQQVGRTKSRAFWNHPLSTVVNTLPHPSPARFITHPHRRDTNGDHSPFRDTIDDVPSTSDSVTNESTLVEEQRLLSLMGGANEETPTTMGIRKGKRVRPARDSRQTESSRRSNVVALNHSPIPATVVFARDAAPLHLPQLDEYLASIPPPPFAPRDGNEEPRMFPPMDALKQSGKSLDDLETNYQKPPAWKNSKSILSGLVNVLLGVLGSSALAPFYSLQGLFNTVQIFALLLSTLVPIGQDNLGDSWRQLFLGTIPDVLALNFASTLVQSLLFLLIFMAIAACLLYRFYRSTKQCNRYEAIEGLQQSDVQGSQWQLIAVTFLLTFIYLPLSTMAVHVLVWSSDLWVVPSPYTNATEFPPILPPLGPPDEFRDPLDFCWTTTMKRNEVNYAPVIIVLSIIVFAFLTIWFPITLRRVIKDSVPKVDKFTELGRRRTEVEMDLEYHRLLSRDRGPFAFLYSGAFPFQLINT